MSEDAGLEQYEAIMARLEEIVKLLEAGRAPLGESLALYQEAQSLSRRADELLRRAELAVDQPASAESAGER